MEITANLRTKDKLTVFLYEIMLLGYVSIAEVDEVLKNIEVYFDEETVLKNGWLAEYAQDISRLLTGNHAIKGADEHA